MKVADCQPGSDLRRLNLSMADLRRACDVIIQRAGGDRVLAEKALLAARLPDGRTFNPDLSIEFIRVIKNGARLESWLRSQQ